MATATAEPEVIVEPFAIEIDAPRNANVRIQSIPGETLRGRMLPARPITDQKTGEEMIPVDQVRHLSMLPEVPGQQLYVNPAALEYEIRDPLFENEKLCDKLTKRLRASAAFRSDHEIKGSPPRKGTLDPHRMKTLCREMVRLVNEKHARPVKGKVLPSLEEINALPGKYLLNPGAVAFVAAQPEYEEDLPTFQENLRRYSG